MSAIRDILCKPIRELLQEDSSSMRDVKCWEHASTNSAEYIIAHLIPCGHTRTFNGNTPLVGNKKVRCWECDKRNAQVAEDIRTGTATWHDIIEDELEDSDAIRD